MQRCKKYLQEEHFKVILTRTSHKKDTVGLLKSCGQRHACLAGLEDLDLLHVREQRLHELPRGVVLGREGLAAEEPEGDVRRRELPNHPGHLVGTINISLAFHAVIQFTKQRDVYQKTKSNLRQLPDFFLMKESQRLSKF